MAKSVRAQHVSKLSAALLFKIIRLALVKRVRPAHLDVDAILIVCRVVCEVYEERFRLMIAAPISGQTNLSRLAFLAR